MYALKILKAHGLRSISLDSVTNGLVLSHLLYAIPAWWGYCKATDKAKLQGVVNKCNKWGLIAENKSPIIIEKLVSQKDQHLFSKVLNNSSHTLHKFLPPVKSVQYNLRARAHNRVLPIKQSNFIANNFITRMFFDSL